MRTFAPDKETATLQRDRLKDKKISGIVVAATDRTLTRWLGREWTESAERADRLALPLLSERSTSTQVEYLSGYVVGTLDTATAVVVCRKVLAGDPTGDGTTRLRQSLGRLTGTARNSSEANKQLVEKLFADLAAEPYPKAVRDSAAAELKSLRQR